MTNTITEPAATRTFGKALPTSSGLRVQISERLARSAEICRAIGRLSNLAGIIPVWSDGEHIDLGTHEEICHRMEFVHRGSAVVVEGTWFLSGADEDVCGVFTAAVLEVR